MKKFHRFITWALLVSAVMFSTACTAAATPVSRSTGAPLAVSRPGATSMPSVIPPATALTPSPNPATATPSPVLPTPTLMPSPSPVTPTALPLPTRVVTRVREVTRPRAERGSEFDDFRLRGDVIAETPHFEFYADDDYFPVPVDEFKEQAEVVFDYVSTRLQTSSGQKIAVSFRPPSTEPCPARGLAMPGESPPRIFIMADEQTSQEQLLGVLAHEVGHILHHAENALASGNSALSEGLATWAAEDYYNAWQGMPSFDDRVRSYVRDGVYLPLYENYELRNTYRDETISSEDCLARRDTLYTEWATFIDYLIEQYGWAKLRELYETPDVDNRRGEIVIKPPDFESVYGHSLNQLEAAWLTQLATQQ